jgi:hypothetical protein
MHAAAMSWMLVALLGQAGGDFSGDFRGFGDPPTDGFGPRMSVSAGATTRSTRATTTSQETGNPLGGSYPPTRVATSPRYATTAQPDSHQPVTLPPVGDSSRVAQEDPHSALAHKLLGELIAPTAGDQSVRPLRLVDALERASGSQQQFTAIKAYWDWTLAVSELHGVLEEDTVLSRVPAPRTALLHAAQRKASHARLEDSQLDVAAKLVDLLDAGSLRGIGTPLRPAEIPYASTYNTNFSRLFPGNSAPQPLRKIHQTLPYALKVIRSRADAYATSRQAMNATEGAYQKGQASYHELIDAIALARSQRRAFLDSVHDYNFAIAEYALSIAGPGLQRETVVSMLIRTSSTPSTNRGASTSVPTNVIPAARLEGIDSSNWRTYLVSPPEPAELRPTLGDDASAVGTAIYGDFGNAPAVLLR